MSERRGFGAAAFVFPRSEKYTIKSGIDAMNWTGDLCFRRISKTLPRNLRRVATTNEMMRGRYTGGYGQDSDA